MERDTSHQAGSSQVPVLITDTAVASANELRRRLIVRNNDSTNPIYIAPVTATTSHFLVKAGESIEIHYRGAVRAISTGGTVVVSVWEEYD